MAYQKTISSSVPSLSERRSKIEGMGLPANIYSLLKKAAEEVGDQTLWNFFELKESISYKDALLNVEKLAAGFQRLGITKGTHVAVMLPNRPSMPLTWLALGTLGAVMVPVNTSYMHRELTFVLDSRLFGANHGNGTTTRCFQAVWIFNRTRIHRFRY